MTLLGLHRQTMSDESGNSVLEFVLVMPLTLVLVLGSIVETGTTQKDKFASASIVQELARGIELGRTPREISARAKELELVVGGSEPPSLEFLPLNETSATLSLKIGDSIEFARVRLANANALWLEVRSDRGSMLPLFSVVVGLMLAIGFSSANVVSGMIADERAQKLASDLAIDLSTKQLSEFELVSSELMRSSQTQFEWDASRRDSKTTEVRVCVAFEPPLDIFLPSSLKSDKPLACASRSARVIN